MMTAAFFRKRDLRAWWHAPLRVVLFLALTGPLLAYDVTVTGSTSGSVWGSGPYTDDSSVATAAVHAGLIAPGQTATIRVHLLPGQSSYSGSTQNGVTTSSYGAWGGSYSLQLLSTGGGGGGGGGGNQSPAATLTGSTSLLVGQTGSWSFGASDPDGNLKLWRFRASTNPGAGWTPISGSVVSGLHTASFSLPGSYTWIVEVEDMTGATDATSLNVWVEEPASAPVITSHPSSRAVNAGTSTTFSVAASGTAPFTYQWRKNGAAIPGATSSSYTISSVQSSHAGSYDVVVGNSAGSAISSGANLSVASISPPVISSRMGVSGGPGTAFRYQITATNSPTSFSAGPLPSWLSFNASTGLLTGTPSQTGITELTIGASNAGGSASQNLRIDVSPSENPHVAFGMLAPIQIQVNNTALMGGEVTDRNGDMSTIIARWKGQVAQQWGGLYSDFESRYTYVSIGSTPGAHIFRLEAADSRYTGGDNGATGFHARESVVQVLSFNNPPVGEAVSASVVSPARIDLSGSATDSDGNLAYLLFYISSPPHYNGYHLAGMATVAGSAASGTYVWQPSPALESGTYHVSMRVQDSHGAVDSNGGAVTSFYVGPSATPGIAVSSSQLPMGNPVSVSYQHAPSAHSSIGVYRFLDPDSSPLSLTTVPHADSGTVSIPFAGILGQSYNVRLFAGSDTSTRLATSNNFVPTENLTLTVLNGTGGGTGLASQIPRTITAHAPPAGQIFSGWTHVSGPGTIGDARVTPTTFTLRGEDATVRANFSPLAPPAILVQPSSHMRTVGQSAMFEVVASGAPPPAYQWKKDGVDIPGATLPRFVLNSVQSGDAGTYTVLVGNTQGQVLSGPATLTVEAPASVWAAIGVGPNWSVTLPGSTTVTWSTAGATSASVVGPGLNSVALDGSQTVTGLSIGRHTYTLTATGPSGTVVRNAIFTVASQPTAPTRPADGSLVGALPASLSVDNKGAANYVIPLPVQPGRGGLQPDLALTYNSNAGNGPLGVGWSISTGLPQSITRGRSIYARDGYVHGMRYDDADRLYLDGKRLLHVNATSSTDPYWKIGNQYRTEIDSFAVVTALGNNGALSGPGPIEGFKIVYKDGTTAYFGKIDAVSADALHRSVNVIRAWAIRRHEDTLGNRIEFYYNAFSDGTPWKLSEHLLSRIEYTGNPAAGIEPQAQVKFIYTPDDIPESEVRPDVFEGFLGGQGTTMLRRLALVEMSTRSGANWVALRRFTPSYETAVGSGLSRLKWGVLSARSSATAAWEALSPMEFTYDDRLPAEAPLADPSTTGVSTMPDFPVDPLTTATGDFNGDGRTDKIVGPRLYLGSESGFELASASEWGSHFPANCRFAKVADVNGDGFSDVVWVGMGSRSISVTPSAGKSFGASYVAVPAADVKIDEVTTNASSEVFAARVSLGDFNGDGRADILLHQGAQGSNGTQGRLWICYSNGSGFGTPTYKGETNGRDYAYNVPMPDEGTYYSVVAAIEPIIQDFNGDGADDYAWVQRARWTKNAYGPHYEIHQALSVAMFNPQWGTSAATMGTSAATILHSQSNENHTTLVTSEDYIFHCMPGDCNGDGLPDLLVLGKSPNHGAGDIVSDKTKWFLYRSTGGFGFDMVPGVLPEGNHNLQYEFNHDYFASGDWVTHASNERVQSGGMFLQDINHDGRSDYIWVYGGAWSVSYGATNGFAAPVDLWDYNQGALDDVFGSDYIPARDEQGRGGLSLEPVDVDGDGASDWLITYNPVPGTVLGPLLAKGRGGFRDRLTHVTNELGEQSEIAYKTISDDSVYTPGVAVSYPIREVRGSQAVVSDTWRDTGSASRSHLSYQYSGNRLDLSGRDGLGFHSFVTLNRQTNVIKYQFLAQSFPMTGLTHREEVYRYLGPNSFNLISSQDNTIVFDKVATSGGATLWPFISKAVESRWEDGAGHLTPTAAGVTSNPDSNPENLFKLAKPAGAHVTITAESLFDEQAAVQTTLPGSSGYHASDVNGSSNVVKGTADQAAFNALLAAFNNATYGKVTHGNLTQLKTNYGGGYIETVDTVYEPMTSNGIASRVQTVTTTVTSPGYGTEVAPIKSYTYWSNGATPTPLVASETVDAGDDRLDLTTTYERDERGRVEKTTIEGRDLLALDRPSMAIVTYEATDFDDRFDLPTVEKNAYGHATTTVYHSFLGKPTSVTDVNGAQVTTGYDALGRVVKVTDVLKGLETINTFESDDTVTVAPPQSGPGVLFNGVTPGAAITGVEGLSLTSAYKVTTTTTVQPTVTTWHDRLGRPLRTVKGGFGNQQISTDTAYNTLGQTIAVSLPYAEGTAHWTKTAYDELGRVKSVTAPNGTVSTSTYNGRVTSVEVDAPEINGVNPPAQINSTLVDAKGHTVKVWNADNPAGSVSGVTGAGGNTASIEFALDGFGRMRETTLKGQSQKITAKYDALGRQTQLADPDKGEWNYTNSPLGHVLKQTDARLIETKTTYDVLGRLLIRKTTEPSNGPVETTKWYYWDISDGSPAQEAFTATQRVSFTTEGWIGALQRVKTCTKDAPGYARFGTNSESETGYYYDSKGRLEREISRIGERWFTTQNSYDDYSRLAGVRHDWRPPQQESASASSYVWEDFGYTYHYDAKSYLRRIDDMNTPVRTWWKAHDESGYDHLDRPVLVQKGTGHWTHRSYRETDGVLTAIVTGPTAGSAAIQNLAFGYDGLGNLVQRAGSGGSETYRYDELNRLRSRNGSTIASYEPNGNISSKIAVGDASSGTYVYNLENKPHAVRQAFGYTMGYDANGNLESREGHGETWAFRYAGFDKPRWMARDMSGDDFTEGVAGSEFLYNGNRSRTVQLEFDEMSDGVPSRYVRKRIYGLGSTLEANYEAETPGLSPVWKRTKVRIYVPGLDGIIGAREFDTAQPSGGTEKALVYHYDHLGSIESITPFGSTSVAYAADSDGKPGRFSADAWGQRRNPFTWSGAPVTTGNNKSDDGGADSLTPRGFTGHEMLDDLGFVHANGRIYDPLLGRFLSADILVSNPHNLQNYNRFSYCGNNPTSTTDPNGFQSEAEKKERNRAAEKWANGTRTLYVSSRSIAEGASAVAAGQSQAAPTPNSQLQGVTTKLGDKVNPVRTGLGKNGDRWLTDVPFADSPAPNRGGGVSALTNAKLSQGIYNPDFTGADGFNMVAGSLKDDPKTGLRTAVFSDGTHYVQVFAGTSPSSWANWRANLKQAFGFKSAQYEAGMQSARDNKKLYGENLSFTGHSLGGGIASASAIITGLSAVTFNAAGVHNNTIGDFSRSNGSVTSYYSTFDVLRVINAITPTSASVPGQRISLGAAGFHGMDSMVKALEGIGPDDDQDIF